MNTRFPIALMLLCVFCLATDMVAAEELGWPRQHTTADAEVVLFQPQVDGWDQQETLECRAAISVKPTGAEEPTLGVIELKAKTQVNKTDRTVLFTEPESTITFPEVDAEEAARLVGYVREALPKREFIVVDLDRVLSYMSVSEVEPREVEVNLDPPPIYYSETPAILVIFMGDPVFKPVEGTNLLFATNTNWDLFMETGESKYYLLNGEHWLTTSDLDKREWEPAASLPKDLQKLPDDANWEDVKKYVNAKPPAEGMAVFVSKEPAELILTNEDVEMTPIPGTKLMLVGNTDSDLFFNSEDRNYYFLVAGRWFRSEKLEGPWKAATLDLPSGFANIPEDHSSAGVLASVPGTPEAAEAVIQASVPQKATVQKTEVNVEVTFEGDPEFKVIEGSQGVEYGANTTYTVLRVNKKYYCCESGVWFVSNVATGPYVVCTDVPTVIYTIPVSSPYHNVTYVYVYDSTPTTVTVGYTSGYSGTYVSNGLVMFGAGMALGYALGSSNDHWYCWRYSPCYYSYGCHAHFSYRRGGYVRSCRYYGPYGGAGYASRYNPRTGRYTRGAYAYGPRGSAGFVSAYNPVTGRYARAGYVSGPRGTVVGGSRGNVWSPTPYNSWGGSVVASGNNRNRFAARTDGTRRPSDRSRDGNRRANDWKTMRQSSSGDVFAGRDGRVYRREKDNSWQSHSNRTRDWRSTGERSYSRDQSRVRPENWDRSNRSGATQRPTQRKATPQQRDEQKQPTTPRNQQNRQADNRSRQNNTSQLNRDSWSRDRGNKKVSSRNRDNRSRNRSSGNRSQPSQRKRGGGGRRR